MRFAIAVHGTRGDVEPCAAVALELLGRGHQVRMAVPPNLVEFVESAGLSPVAAYGVDSQQQLDAEIFRTSYRVRNPVGALGALAAYMTQGWAQMGETLREMAGDADLVLTGTTFEEVAANVAEHHGVPLAALHYFPFRANAQILPVPVPGWAARAVWPAAETLHWRLVKRADDAQRRALGLPTSRVRAIRRILDSGATEIQAYDPVFFPGLAQEWAQHRPVIGSLTLQRDSDTDASTQGWLDAGPAPIYFGFGSMPVGSPAEAVAMISDVCGELGQRALICSGVWDVPDADIPGHVHLVPTVNHAAVFPRCRAVVHHGGAGTTAAGLRAGRPTLVLWIGAEQPIWARQVTQLGVGVAQRFSAATRHSIRTGVSTLLAPDRADRATALAARMTSPREAVTAAADLLEAAVGRAALT